MTYPYLTSTGKQTTRTRRVWMKRTRSGWRWSYERRLPSEPTNVRVTAPPGEDGTLAVSWDEPEFGGTFPVECYLVEFRHPSGEAKKRKQSYPGSLGPGMGCGDSPPTSVKRTDLEAGVQYQVLVQALSGDGYGDPVTVEATTGRGGTLEPIQRPSCRLSTGDLWCGVVTVEDIVSGSSVAAHGFSGTDGDLDDKMFSVGTNNYTIDGLYVGTAGDLNLDLTGALDAADKGNLELVVGSAAFDLDVATHVSSVNAYLWLSTGLDWSSETYVTLRMRRAVALSTDATLSGLTVYDGSSNLTLSPTFASGTEPYTASAAYDIATVTVTASKNQADATVAWLDASDATLVDADTNASGRQVALEAGDNTFKVKVTAEDGTTTKTYTVTVNRASPSCTLNTGDLWCGVVTVGSDLAFYGYHQSLGVGALSDRTFSVGSNNYTIDTIAVVIVGTDVGDLSVSLTSALSAGDLAKLVVHVGSVALKFSEAHFVDATKSYEFCKQPGLVLRELRHAAAAGGHVRVEGAAGVVRIAAGAARRQEAGQGPGGVQRAGRRRARRTSARTAWRSRAAEVTSVSAVGGDAPGRRGDPLRRAAAMPDSEDREVVWEFEIEPDSDGDLTVSAGGGAPVRRAGRDLHRGRACRCRRGSRRRSRVRRRRRRR